MDLVFDHRDSIVKFLEAQAEKYASNGLNAEATALRATASSAKALIDVKPGERDIANPVIPIAAYAATHFGGCTVRDIIAKGMQSDRVARVRHAVIWAAKKRLNWTNEELGKLFSGRDGSTISHSVSRGEQLRDEDPEFRRITDELTTEQYRCEHCLNRLIQN